MITGIGGPTVYFGRPEGGIDETEVDWFGVHYLRLINNFLKVNYSEPA
jgi:hypothetical protein